MFIAATYAVRRFAAMQLALSPDAQLVLDREREIIRRVGTLFPADQEITDQLTEIADRLDQLFLVVVVGEFNAGKSSFLNALFGERLLEEGPVPTTAKVNLLKHGDSRSTRQLSDVLVEQRLPGRVAQECAPR